MVRIMICNIRQDSVCNVAVALKSAQTFLQVVLFVVQRQ